jgi:hypothetical protein
MPQILKSVSTHPLGGRPQLRAGEATVPTCIRLPESLHTAVGQACAERGVSMGALVRLALHKFLKVRA